jgi:hypothetical protein
MTAHGAHRALGRRDFLRGASASLASVPGLMLLNTRTAYGASHANPISNAVPHAVTDHFRVFGSNQQYAEGLEQDLADLNSLRGHPFYGIVDLIVTTTGVRAFGMSGCHPRIYMSPDSIYESADPTIHELVRSTSLNFHPLLNRGFGYLSQNVLRPNKKVFGTQGVDIYRALSGLKEPSLEPYAIGDISQYIADASFMAFLTDRFGMEKFLDYFAMAVYGKGVDLSLRKKEKIIFDMTYDELIAHWKHDVRDRPADQRGRVLDIKFPKYHRKRDPAVSARWKDKLRINIKHGGDLSKPGEDELKLDIMEAWDFVAGQYGYPNRLDKQEINYSISEALDPSLRPNRNQDQTNLEMHCLIAFTGHSDFVSRFAVNGVGGVRGENRRTSFGNIIGRFALGDWYREQTRMEGYKIRDYRQYGVDIHRIAKFYNDDHPRPLIETNIIVEDTNLDRRLPPRLLAGSFGKFLVEERLQGGKGVYRRHPAVAFRDLATGNASFEQLFGADPVTLDGAWRAYLKQHTFL